MFGEAIIVGVRLYLGDWNVEDEQEGHDEEGDVGRRASEQ